MFDKWTWAFNNCDFMFIKSMANLVTISEETVRIDNGCSFEKEFI